MKTGAAERGYINKEANTSLFYWRLTGRPDRTATKENGMDRVPQVLQQLWRPAERKAAQAPPTSLPREESPEPDIPLSEQVLEPRARTPARPSLPDAGLRVLDTSQLDPAKVKEVALEMLQRESPAGHKRSSGAVPEEHPRVTK